MKSCKALRCKELQVFFTKGKQDCLIYKGALSNDSDINDVEYTKPGQWYRPTEALSVLHWPEFNTTSITGKLLCFGSSETSITSGQVQFVVNYAGGFAYRCRVASSWASWHYVGQATEIETIESKSLLYRGAVPANADINSDEYSQPGQWYIPLDVTESLGNNWPLDTDESGKLVCFGTVSDTSLSGSVQLAFNYTGEFAYRYRIGSTWYSWHIVPTANDLDNLKNMSYVGGRLSLSDGSNIDDYYRPGSYGKPSSATVTGLPKQNSGNVYIMNNTSANVYKMYQNNNSELWFKQGSNSWQLASPGNKYGYPLAGKIMMGLGSSFMRQASGSSFVPIAKQWFSLIGDKYAMTYYNNGLAASPIARNDNQGAVSMVERIDSILTPHENTATDQTNGTLYPGESIDYFVLLGGGNDSSKSVPLGNIDSTTDTEFHGAINIIIDKIRITYPKCKILLITAFRRWNSDSSHGSSGNSLGLFDQDYADAMVESARYNSVQVFDAWHESGLLPKYGDTSSDNQYWPWISSSNKHLNESGNSYIAPLIVRRLEFT